MKKLMVAMIMAVMVIGSAGASVYATDINVAGAMGESPVELTAEGVQFKATVPLKFPFSIDAQGQVSVANDLYIHNMSAAPIKATAGVVNVGATGWLLNDYDLDNVTHYKNLKVNTKAYGFLLNGTKADEATGAMNVSGGTWGVIGSAGFDAVADTATNTNTLPLVYAGKFAPQSTAQTDLVIGTVELTLDFDTAD